MAVEMGAVEQGDRQVSITQVRKRDGRLVPFNQVKIADAIFKAAQAVQNQ